MHIRILTTIFFLFGFRASFGQYKIVEITSEKIYVRFFYKLKESRYTKNDSTYYLCKTINDSTFNLEKYVNKSKIWRTSYRVIAAAKDLIVYEQSVGKDRKPTVTKAKTKYYIGLKLN